MFDIKFYYGQDNDLSYRITIAGYKLVLAKEAGCSHFWPESLGGFMKQRFNGAVGRMKLVRKYKNRWKGDAISNLSYFLELPLGTSLTFFLPLCLINFNLFFYLSIGILTVIYILEWKEIRFFLGKNKIFIGIFLPFFYLPRSLAWSAGIIYFLISKSK